MAEFRLQVLLDLAHRRLDAATAELQRLRGNWQGAQDKLDQLKNYEAEYAATLEKHLAAGIAVPQLNDYRLFLAKLAAAVLAQMEEVKRRQKLWETEHASWLVLRQKQQALEVLGERHLAAEAMVESKREQKQQDEFASRSGEAKPFQD